MKLFFRLFSIVLLSIPIAIKAQETKPPEQQSERQVWIRLKSGPVITGNLIKMNPETVDFTVKGILQSVRCDDLIGVMLVPPSPRPTAPQSQSAPVSTPEKPQAKEETAQSAQLPDKCTRRQIQLSGGQYNHTSFGQTLRDFSYRGSFKAQGGKISVYIVDSENYAKLINHKKFNAYHSAVNVIEGSFDVPLQKGDYHLVWWNESVYDSRLIEAEICFSYPQ